MTTDHGELNGSKIGGFRVYGLSVFSTLPVFLGIGAEAAFGAHQGLGERSKYGDRSCSTRKSSFRVHGFGAKGPSTLISPQLNPGTLSVPAHDFLSSKTPASPRWKT